MWGILIRGEARVCGRKTTRVTRLRNKEDIMFLQNNEMRNL
jgi:hypothetical protein